MMLCICASVACFVPFWELKVEIEAVVNTVKYLLQDAPSDVVADTNDATETDDTAEANDE